MGEAVVTKALSTTDSIFVVLFIGLLLGAAWLIRWVLNTNNEREKRYIVVIENQASALKDVGDMRGDVKDIKALLLQERK